MLPSSACCRRAFVAACLALLSCDPPALPPGGASPSSLPPVPALDVTSLEPLVRAQLTAAFAAAAAAPGDAEASGRLGMALHAYGWLDKARDAYLRASRLAARDARWWYFLGRVEALLGDVPASTAAIERTVALRPDHVPALLFLGEQALADGRLDVARERFARSLELSPASPHALTGLGQVELRSGRAAEGAARFEAALTAAPRHGPAIYGLAMAKRSLGDLRATGDLLARHATADKVDSPPDPILDEIAALRGDSDDLFRKANEAFKAGRLEAAIALYGRTLELNPHLAMARYDIALALQRLDRDAEAIPHYQAFLEKQPASLDAHNNLGLCDLQLGRLDEAAAAFDRALAIDSTYTKARYNLGLVRERQGDLAAAADCFRGVLASRPDHVEARYSLSQALQRAGRGDEALEQALELLRARPDDERVLRDLARDLGDPATGAAWRRLGAQLKGRRLFAAAVAGLRLGLEADRDWRTAAALGWLLATCPDERLRDPAAALRILEPIAAAEGRDEAPALDALAAALAGVGKLPEAVTAARRALELARASKDEAVARRAAGIATRLALYEKGVAYVEE